MRPRTERGRALLAGLVMLAFGLAIGLPPLAILGPGVGIAVAGGLVFILAIRTPPDEAQP